MKSVRSRAVSPLAAIARPAFALLVAASLLAAVLGGLLRAGVTVHGGGDLLPRSAVAHAALMLSGFLGTVIAIERAVAIRQAWAFIAPMLSGASALLMLAGGNEGAAAGWVVAGLVFVAVNVVVVQRQRADHTALLLLAALAWLAGHALFAAGRGGDAVLALWFAFPILTIAAERLEMTRLMRRHPAAHPSLFAIVALLLAGAAGSALAPAVGGTVFGLALFALAIWLGLFDIARRTMLAHGLSRYMALCLLTGYVWLAVAGIAWAAMAQGAATRDTALHALGLGFILSMVMGHAPVILPAVARIKLLFGPWFYLPLVLLHASLLLRLAGAPFDPAWRAAGATLNAVALGVFIATIAGSAVAWRWHRAAPLPHEGLRCPP